MDAALLALADCSWPKVRMVEVARAAGVSRQTLYNEFGSKRGLAHALVRRETTAYLRGVEHALHRARDATPGERLAALAEWTVGQARANPLLRAVLTGCWDPRLPVPAQLGRQTPGTGRSRGWLDGPAPGIPSPSELVDEVRDRAVAALGDDLPPTGVTDPATVCEVAVRLTLACTVAPVEVREAMRLCEVLCLAPPRAAPGQ